MRTYAIGESAISENAIHFAMRKMDVSEQTVIDALEANDTAVLEVVATPPTHTVPRDLRPEAVDLAFIATNLNLPVSEFAVWVADDLLWISYAAGTHNGITSDGATPQGTTIQFFVDYYQQTYE